MSLIRVRVRHFRNLVEDVDEALELLRQLEEDGGECLAADRAAQVVGERAVGTAAHGDVVVDVDQLAREALREEAGDEQRDVTEATQRFVALLGGRRFGGVGEHVRERLEAHALGSRLVELLRAREHGENVDDVVLGVVVHVDPLLAQRSLHGVVKELAQVRDCNERLSCFVLLHHPTPL